MTPDVIKVVAKPDYSIVAEFESKVLGDRPRLFRPIPYPSTHRGCINLKTPLLTRQRGFQFKGTRNAHHQD